MSKVRNENGTRTGMKTGIRCCGPLLFLALCLLFSFLSSTAAQAAEKRIEIKKVRLVFESDIIAGDANGDVDITVNEKDAPYSVSGWDIINDEGQEWNKLEPPVIEVELVTDEEYYFGKTSSSGFDLDLASKQVFQKVEFQKASRRENKTALRLRVRMQFHEDDKLRKLVYKPSKLRWSETDEGTGSWEKAIGAHHYEVKMERDEVKDSTAFSATDTDCNFRSRINGTGTYRFWVRTVKENKVKSSWVKSNRWKVGQEELDRMGIGWRQAEDGVRWWWSNGDGTWPAAQWKEADGTWYYFDAEGYMVTGRQNIGGTDYYFNTESGALQQ